MATKVVNIRAKKQDQMTTDIILAAATRGDVSKGGGDKGDKSDRGRALR